MIDDMADLFRFPATPTPAPPKCVHRATFFVVVSSSGRLLTCASYELETALELRRSYADDAVMRFDPFSGVDRDQRVAATASG